jgi:hypothetical protein
VPTIERDVPRYHGPMSDASQAKRLERDPTRPAAKPPKQAPKKKGIDLWESFMLILRPEKTPRRRG